jgi:hypothetical protein
MIYEDLTKYVSIFGPKILGVHLLAQPRLLPSLLPDIHSSIRFAPMSAFAEQVPLRFGGTGTVEPGRSTAGFRVSGKTR